MKSEPINNNGGSLYQRQEKIYPREVKGRFQSLRTTAVLLLLGLYYILPWIPWYGRQAVLFDLPARKFHLFGITLWPQDFFFLTLLLIIAGLSLFFFTALAGRVWCGYACPQTVWTEAFLWMERLVEGSRNQQLKLAKSNWTLNKLRKKTAKQFLWISFSLWTGITFVGYFTPIQTLFSQLFSWQMSGWQTFWVLFYSFATYGNAGFLREQVCKYMCPYARFQSAMFDRDTLIVAYNSARGEPRMRGSKRKQDASAGDCVDCSLCVQVCPTGIDIRDGLQYECIACAACIDVCNQVMDSTDQPRGLIHYTTEAADMGEQKSLRQTLLRPRTLIYAALLMIACAGLLTALILRSPLQIDILRDRNTLFRVVDSNTIENIYRIKVLNKSAVEQRYRIEAIGLNNAQANWHQQQTDQGSATLPAGAIGDFTVSIRQPLQALSGRSQTIELQVTEMLGENPKSVSKETRFWGPATQ